MRRHDAAHGQLLHLPELRQQHRLRLIAAVAAGAIALGVAACGEETTAGGLELGSFDEIELGHPVAALDVDGDALWVAGGGTVSRLDADGEVTGSEDLGGFTQGVAYGAGAVWVVDSDEAAVVKLDPETLEVLATSPAIGDLDASDRVPIAAGEDGVWVGVEDAVVRLDADDAAPVGEPIAVDGLPDDIALADGSVWVSVSIGTQRVPRTSSLPPHPDSIVPPQLESISDPAADDRLARIDAPSGRLDPRPVELPGSSRSMVSDGTTLYVLVGGSDRLLSLDPGDGSQLREPIELPVDGSLAAGEDGTVWVSSQQDNAVFGVDPRSGEVGPQQEVPGDVEGVSGEAGEIAAGLGAVWVGLAIGERLLRGVPQDG